MNVVFRVDSSTKLGAGHLMRCMTLSDELQKQNHKITFICKKLNGNLIKLIKHKVLVLPMQNKFQVANLFVDSVDEIQGQDVIQTIKAIPKNTDYLIVDSYSLDEKWHRQLRPYTRKIMVIDDLADKQFDCDILLNQNLGSKQENYQNKTPYGCELLLGCDYALLRPEFALLREKAKEKRKKTKEIKNILITMGGSDYSNITYDVLKQLDNKFNIIVVLGALSPHNKMIKDYSKDKNIKVIINANNMAELMLNADLAIGASGSTNWERLYLGLPSLVFSVAENQRKYAIKLDSMGLIKFLGHVGENNISNTIEKNILSIDNMSDWSDRCFNSCSCNGVSKVTKTLLDCLASDK